MHAFVDNFPSTKTFRGILVPIFIFGFYVCWKIGDGNTACVDTVSRTALCSGVINPNINGYDHNFHNNDGKFVNKSFNVADNRINRDY